MKISNNNTFTDKTNIVNNGTKDKTTYKKPIDFSKEQRSTIEENIKSVPVEKNDAIMVQKKEPISIPILTDSKEILEKEKISEMIETELKKRNIKKDSVDINYWTDKVYNNATKYNIPAEVIVSIISKESKFTKNIKSDTGNGAMQITNAAINGFLETAKGNWSKSYQLIDENLYNDIKEHMTNLKGEKYTASNVKDECGNNDDFCIKVGILLLKLLYIQQVDKLKHKNKTNYATLKETIESLNNGTVTISAKENETCIQNAFMKYNNTSFKESYAKDVMNSLKHQQNFNFENQIIEQVEITA